MQKAICGWKPYSFPKHLFHYAVQLMTFSEYSHVEILIGEYVYSSSIDNGGVRKKKVDLDKPGWIVIPAPWIDENRVLSFFEETEDRPYGWTDLFVHQVLHLPTSKNDRGYFCSEWCAAALGVDNAYVKTPKDLINYALKRA
jgi:hypothetical protein